MDYRLFMKALFLIPLTALPLLLTACDELYVARPARRTVVVGGHHDDRYDRRPDYDRGYRRDVVVTPSRYDDDRYDRDRRDVVVVAPRRTYEPRVEVRYYSDTRGRYYVRDGRRIYVDSGVRY